MRCNSFARSALFAAGAAGGWLVWIVAAAPTVGRSRATALYLVATTVLYIAGLAPEHERRLATAVIAGVAAAAVAGVAHTTAGLAIGLAAILGVARSAFLYRSGGARALAIEVGLLVSGLLFAGFLAVPWAPSTGLALWGFFLVQSFYFLLARARARSPAPRQTDAFEEAHRRAVALLERSEV
jgi:hypothetical protein